MTKINKITGKIIPKKGDNQNTDDICPARFLREVTFKNMGNYPFFDERKQNKNHPLDNPKYKGGNILLIDGKNFGCGSSREHAPQALMRYGINVIIAESFADIFNNNCSSIGIVNIVLENHEINKIYKKVEENPKINFEINLEEKKISWNKEFILFDMPEDKRIAFLNGEWNVLKILQNNSDKIKKVKEELEFLKYK